MNYFMGLLSHQEIVGNDEIGTSFRIMVISLLIDIKAGDVKFTNSMMAFLDMVEYNIYLLICRLWCLCYLPFVIH